MSEPLSNLLGVLRAAGISLDVEGTRDALWLALRIAEREAPPIPRRASKSGLRRFSRDEWHRESESEGRSRSDLRATRGQSDPSGSVPGLRRRLNAPSSFPGNRTLTRAFWPLRRKTSSPTKLSLDLEETIRRAAEEDVWVPALRPLPERWLNLALVVERSLSMTVFYSTVRELHKALRGSGIFRDIRVWWLDAEGPEVKVYIRREDVLRETGARSLSEVPGSGQRTLVLILSDCVSEGWYDSRILSVLALWSRKASVALLQTLPERMWPRTALGGKVRVRLRSAAELQINKHLHWVAELPDPWLTAEDALLMPVATLDPTALHLLMKMIAGDGQRSVPGFLFFPAEKEAIAVPSELNAAERVSRFIASSSSQAVRLASLLAASPVLSLGVLRLLRRDLLPEASPVQEAEVLLGGILRVRMADGASPLDSEGVEIEFLKDVRPLFLDNATASDVLRVIERTANLAESPGLEAPFFELLLSNPEAVAGRLDPEASSTARETATVLSRLGGSYARVVRGKLANRIQDMRRVVSQSRLEPRRPERKEKATAKILLADNNQQQINIWGALLREEGYEVIMAPSSAAAQSLLNQNGFDLAILDLRLERDEDETDVSGLRLAELYGSSVPVIILTGIPTVDIAVRALRRRGRSSPAVALIGKSDGPKPLLDAVRKAIKPKVFLSYGHDNIAFMELSELLESGGVHVIGLHKQPVARQSIFESFEEYSAVQLAVVLITPDDVGARKGETLRPRARQNVVFELGFLLGKLGHNRVVALVKQEDEPIEWPYWSGIQYLEMSPGGSWRLRLAESMNAAGIKLELM
ncbi:MAG TPA: SAV_2336 N-terminal domain-related protein [Thermoanaerobaculia bacterium]